MDLAKEIEAGNPDAIAYAATLPPREVTEADLRRTISATMLRTCPKCGAHITGVNRGDLAYGCGSHVQRDEHGPRWVQECR